MCMLVIYSYVQLITAHAPSTGLSVSVRGVCTNLSSESWELLVKLRFSYLWCKILRACLDSLCFVTPLRSRETCLGSGQYGAPLCGGGVEGCRIWYKSKHTKLYIQNRITTTKGSVKLYMRGADKGEPTKHCQALPTGFELGSWRSLLTDASKVPMVTQAVDSVMADGGLEEMMRRLGIEDSDLVDVVYEELCLEPAAESIR